MKVKECEIQTEKCVLQVGVWEIQAEACEIQVGECEYIGRSVCDTGERMRDTGRG